MAGSPAKSLRSFSCSNCGGEVLIKAQGWTLHVACKYCGTVFDAQSYKLLQKALDQAFEPWIPLGSRGQLLGHDWELIGALERSQDDGAYSWHEYLLFNPYQGYRWLVMSDGHWSFVKVIRTRPKAFNRAKESLTYKGKTFDLFDKGTVRVDKIIGEFYWRVKIGETVTAHNYVSAPVMLSREVSDSESIWSLGSYIDSADVAKAFGITDTSRWTWTVEVAPHQPYPRKAADIKIMQTSFAFVVLLVVLQCVFSLWAPSRRVLDEQFLAPPGARGAYGSRSSHPQVSSSFELKGSINNLEVRLYSAVNNAWLGVDWELVRESDQTVIEHGQSVEYYSGSDSDGFWSEGSQDASDVLTGVESGKYHLNIYSSFEPASPPPSESASQPFRLQVTRGVTSASNFFLALAALLLAPLIVYKRSRSFERARWGPSDYNPYAS